MIISKLTASESNSLYYYLKPEMINVQETVNLFIEQLKAEGKSNSTLLAYGKDIEQFIKLLNKIHLDNLEELSEEHINLFLESLEGENYTPKSISRKLNSIRTFCKIMNKNGSMTNNPSNIVAHPKIESKEPRVLTELEYRALRDVCRRDQRLYTIVELMLQTGIRIGELARLKLQEIDIKNGKGTIHIRPYGSNAERQIPLNSTAIRAIKDYLEERYKTENDSVFVTKTGRPLLVRNIRTAINRAFKKAGIENVKVNDLRNTFIAHNLAKGVDIVKISNIVGHKRISTTEKYLDLIKGDEQNNTKLEEL